MKHNLLFIILTVIIVTFNGCKKDDSNPTTAQTQSILGSESWSAIMDNDSSDHGSNTFEKKTDGSVATKGTWYYSTQGNEVQCPFTDGPVTIADTVITFTAHGTATNSSAPSGY